MTSGLETTGFPAVGKGGSATITSPLRQRAGSAPTSMLVLNKSLSLHAKTRQFVIEHLTEPWQGILLDFLDLLYQKSSEFLDGGGEEDADLARNSSRFPTIRSAAGGILLLCLLGFFYILLSESVLQFFLPFYAAFSAFYWLVYWWRRKHLTPHNDRQLDFLLAGGFALEVLIALLCRGFQSGYAKGIICAIANLSPILCFVGVKVLYFDDDVIGTLTPAFIVVYLVRIFAKQSFTLFPGVFRPFLGYSACFLGDMAARLVPQQKQVILCSHANDKGLDSPTSSPAHFKSGSGGPPPAASHRLASLGEAEIQRTFAGRSRRTSLPASASSLLRNRAQSNLNEASGLIADMLAKGDLPGHVVSCLKAINRLMNPQPSVDLHLDLGLPKFVENPFSGEQLAVSGQTGRSHTVTWSTTTSATGVSNVEAEPSRARSSSFWAKKNESSEREPISARGDVEKVAKCVFDGTEFDFKEMEADLFLSCISDWDFPIFKLNNECPDTLLTKVIYTMFNECDLFRLFKISKSKFVNFFHSLEKGYWDIPYHNRVHAADVSHSCYHLTFHPVPVISSEEGESEPLSTVMSALEMMALFTAAAMHDYDHPGRTNAFLVAAGDPKAILYNDRSVLENHHAAASWTLLSKTDNYFIDQLDPSEYKRFRFLVTELILSTDLKHHFDVLMEFNSKQKGGGLDWEQEGDRLLACKMVMKMGDINSPMKPNYLHRQWTERIVQEFYAQGDAERVRHLPVSPYMNRDEPNVAKLQDSFIAHLIFPMAQAMNDAGLLPTETESLGPAPDSEIMLNLKDNHKYWLNELGKQDNQGSDEDSQSSQDEDNKDGDMGTIGEEEEDDEL